MSDSEWDEANLDHLQLAKLLINIHQKGDYEELNWFEVDYYNYPSVGLQPFQLRLNVIITGANGGDHDDDLNSFDNTLVGLNTIVEELQRIIKEFKKLVGGSDGKV